MHFLKILYQFFDKTEKLIRAVHTNYVHALQDVDYYDIENENTNIFDEDCNNILFNVTYEMIKIFL